MEGPSPRRNIVPLEQHQLSANIGREKAGTKFVAQVRHWVFTTNDCKIVREKVTIPSPLKWPKYVVEVSAMNKDGRGTSPSDLDPLKINTKSVNLHGVPLLRDRATVDDHTTSNGAVSSSSNLINDTPLAGCIM